jgi:hypothetical protein
MKKLGRLALIAILSLIMVSMTASTFLMSGVRASPLPPGLAGADLNQDGNVTLSDFAGFVLVYHMTSASPSWTQPIHNGWLNASAADFNNNSRIDLGDLVSFAYAFYTNRT